MNRLVFSFLGFVLMMQVANFAYADNVDLAWDPSTDAGLAGYRVYRSEQQGVYTSKALNGSLLTMPSWTDSSVKNNHTYYYVVRAVNTNSLESGNSNEVSVTIRSNKITAADQAMPISDVGGNGLSFTNATAVPLMTAGRVYAETQGAVNTGVTMNNPNGDSVTLDFYFTDAAGNELYSNRTSIPAGGQISALLTDVPFAPPPDINVSAARTFTFSASAPIAVTAVHGLANERSEFLMTRLPIAELSSAAGVPIVFPYDITGETWETEIKLVNPSNTVLAGVVNFYAAGNSSIPASYAVYAIPPRSGFTLQVPQTASESRVGSIDVTPLWGSPTPSGLVILSMHEAGVTVSQTGIYSVSNDSLQ